MDNKTKGDRIHELLPRLLNSRRDENWTAIIEAIGNEDDRLATLVEEVRNQFFVKTASRPYLDRLAANRGLNRPMFVGINDTDFRRYIPVLSYQPKQVKQIVETLLDIFFFKEATTAFLSSALYQPFFLKDGWDLQLNVDNVHNEQVVFCTADFTNILAITADELVAAYNRQAKYSYAVVFFDSVIGQNYLRIFTNTIGNEGSLRIIGGLANIGLELNGFLTELGTGTDTQWTVSKIGDVVEFAYTGGALPGVNHLEPGDIFLSDLEDNEGSFEITSVDLQNQSFQFVNLFATEGTISQTISRRAKFLRPEKIAPYRLIRRALVWETQVGQTTIEMPATPSIVKRDLKGGFHINGRTAVMTSYNMAGECYVDDATNFPSAGQFVIEPVMGISTRHTDDEVVTYLANGRLISPIHYTYTGRNGDQLTGITPQLPVWNDLHEFNIVSAVRLNGVVTCQALNELAVGDKIFVRESSGIPTLFTTAETTVNSPILTNVGSFANVATGQLVKGEGVPDSTYVISISRGDGALIMSNTAIQSASVGIAFAENTNGTFTVDSRTPTSFTYPQLGLNGTVANPGYVSVERIGLWDAKVILTSAIPASNTGIIGPYVWDPQAPFVLSSYTTQMAGSIMAGKSVKLLEVIIPNDVPNDGGYIVFDYGKNTQEGPVRYFYKPSENLLALDSSYVFRQYHNAGCPITVIDHQEGHTSSGVGAEYPPYLTNPPDARLALQELIQSVTSAGTFIDFLIRYPAQLYGTLAVYD
jgi:hypothetical protein